MCNLRTDLRKRLQDKSDAPVETRGDLPRISISSKKRKNLDFPCRIHNKPEEREFVVDSGALMHMLCRNHLDSADLETVRASKSPTTVVTANGKVLTKD